MQNEFDYKKYLGLINNHKRLFAFTALAIMTGTVVFCYLQPKKYEAKSVVFVQRNVLNELVRGIAVTPTVEDTLKGLNSTIKSRTILIKVINDLDLNVKQQSDAQLEATIAGMQYNTTVQLDYTQGLITISFTNGNPRLTRDYVNALVRRYIEDNLSLKREESYGASNFLSDQSATVKNKLEKVEAEISRLRSEKGAALASDPASMQTQINAAQERLDELNLRRSQLEATRNQLRSNNPAKNRLAALQRRLEELRVEYTDNYPEVVKVKADIEAAKREMGRGDSTSVTDPQELARVEAELSAVRASEANQRSLLASSRGLMHANPAAITELGKLEEERNSYRAMFDQLMARHGQAEMSKQMEVQDKTTTFRIVEPAVMPVSPISPNRVRIILIGIAAGIAAGFGLLLAIDYFDRSVKTVDTLKALGINVLAVIPKISDPQAIEIERRRDIRLYLVSGVYFSMIVALLALEFLGISPVERIIGMIQG
jgi:succinoglycan biosynthesis transport protein ExoP